MILTAHQPVYLPWLGLFHKIAIADQFVSFNQVQYLPKDWNNRNKILTSNGPTWLTVPVLKSGHREKSLTEIEINNDTSWNKKHWKSIFFTYSKAKYFKTYADFFEDIYNKNWQYLCDLNDTMLKWFLQELGIKTEFFDARDFNFEGKKNNLVLDMCSKMKASLYIFGSLGKEYADVAAFNDKGIDVYFQEYNHPTYAQLLPGFTSHMCILDLLFNYGPNSLEVLMQGNISKSDLSREFCLTNTTQEN